MNANQKQLEYQKTERQLDQSAARLKMLEARARQENAEGALAEVSGLQELSDRIRRQFKAWKEADEASFDQLREEVGRGTEALSRGAEAAADRFDRIGDANDHWLDAEADQISAAFEMFQAWLGEERVEDQQAAAGAREDLRAAWDDAGKKHQALKSAAREHKDEARRALQGSLMQMKSKLQKVAERFKKKAQEPTTEKRP